VFRAGLSAWESVSSCIGPDETVSRHKGCPRAGEAAAVRIAAQRIGVICGSREPKIRLETITSLTNKRWSKPESDTGKENRKRTLDYDGGIVPGQAKFL